jgi:hypothetical protein
MRMGRYFVLALPLVGAFPTPDVRKKDKEGKGLANTTDALHTLHELSTEIA